MRYLLVLLMMVTLRGAAQNSNFNSKDGDVEWNNAFVTTMSVADVYKLAKLSGSFESVDTVGSRVVGELRQFDVDYKGAGYALSQTPILLSGSHFKGFVTIQVTPAGCIVNAKKIVLTQAYDDPLDKMGTTTTLGYWMLDKHNGFRPGYIRKEFVTPLHYTFNKLLSFLNE